MKVSLGILPHKLRQLLGRRPASGLDPAFLKKMARAVATTHPEEIGCNDCFEQMDRFVEMSLAGRNAAEAMPLVQDHLLRCGECREEFEALLAALLAVS